MKTTNIIGYTMLVALSLLLFSCTSEPIQGPPGADGIDGVDGVDGMAGTASCIACHSDSHREPIESSYLVSLHALDPLHTDRATGDQIKTSDYTNRSGCVQCHTSDGYIDYVNGRPLATGTGYPDNTAYPYGQQTISCVTCHDEHSTFDFENDGHDYALRHFDPVTLVYDQTTIIDFGDTSNNCITCHQPRDSYVVPSGVDDYNISSSRFGPHHGPQSTMVEGILGANIAGTEGYPGVGTSSHRTGASCVTCHMDSSTTGLGKHSMIARDEMGTHVNACTDCHGSNVPEEVTGYATDFKTLHDLLVATGAINEDGSTISGTYPVKVAQAVWNYKTLEEDKSNGIHNPNYAKALLKNSIEALQ